MMPSPIIVDASVGAKWFFKEEGSEKAAVLMHRFKAGKIKIIVPEIFYAELANICWKRVWKKLALVDDAIKALDYAVEMRIQRWSNHELSDVALENALSFHISVYDGLYLALAEIYLAPFVTADGVLFKACQKKFDFIEYLPETDLF